MSVGAGKLRIFSAILIKISPISNFIVDFWKVSKVEQSWLENEAIRFNVYLKNPCHGMLEFQIFLSAILPVLFLVSPQPLPFDLLGFFLFSPIVLRTFYACFDLCSFARAISP